MPGEPFPQSKEPGDIGQGPKGSLDKPYIPASRSLPELTVKALVLGVILAVVLGAANAYLGLFAGMTVSASIPAAVISMAVLKALKGNILENNVVQTAASAGESIAAGVIFTMPAMVLMHYWQDFHYWETLMIAGFGGVLGVLFTIPLRRALIVETDLRFPEGFATAEVLKIGDKGGDGVKFLGFAALAAAAIKFCEAGIQLWRGSVQGAFFAGNSVFYGGIALSPALIAVGYIVGLNIAVVTVLGGVLNWFIAVPIASATMDLPAGSAVDAAMEVWSSQTRYLGVGAMVVGGLWALIALRTPLIAGVKSGIHAYRRLKQGGPQESPRTEHDVPMPWVLGAMVAAVVPLFLIFFEVTGDTEIALVMAFVMLVLGFLFSAVAGYMAGLVGSSNNPVSGVTIATILISALLMLAMTGAQGMAAKVGAASAVLIGAVVCSAAAIAGDNMQDLKAGHLVGATPWKLQVMQWVGAVAAALVMAPVLQLLLDSYGIGDMGGQPGSTHLAAPQAELMASVATGVFTRDLPWPMIFIGMGIGGAVIVADEILKAKESKFRLPVLAMAIGIYLPLTLTVAIAAGGFLSHFAHQSMEERLPPHSRPTREEGVANRHGLLFAAGLITGEAILGILLAIPIVIAGKADVMSQWIGGAKNLWWLGVLSFVGILFALYRVASHPPGEDDGDTA